MRYDEDHLVQQTTAEYLSTTLGWQNLYAYNSEVFNDAGPLGQRADAKTNLGRSNETETVLRRHLHAALVHLNPGLPEEAYSNAIRQLTEANAAQSLLQTNREFYALILFAQHDRLTGRVFQQIQGLTLGAFFSFRGNFEQLKAHFVI